MMKAIFKLFLGLSLVVLVLALAPLATIWSLNTLFPVLAIPYTWETWAAATVLFGGLFGGSIRRSR